MLALNRYALVALALLAYTSVSAHGTLMQVTESFTNNTDTYWDSSGNRTSPHDYGWSNTDHTGTGTGELGGVISRETTGTYYGFDVGSITLDDAWSFSGVYRYVNNAASSGLHIGFFSGDDSIAGSEISNFIGLLFNNGSAPILRAYDRDGARRLNNQTHSGQGSTTQTITFAVSWDPTAGAVTFTINDATPVSSNVNKALFDGFTHLGMMNVITDPAGNWAEGYFDDLTFTSRNAIPEPTGLALLGVPATLLMLRRRRVR